MKTEIICFEKIKYDELVIAAKGENGNIALGEIPLHTDKPLAPAVQQLKTIIETWPGLLEALKAVEYSDRYDGIPCCPICREFCPQHMPECKLGNAIANAEGRE
ncbi:MAG: hypothetical protein A2017_18195 [Lentisphaerae bacterium GWF2_44_16]|nr:MAG: hypothetical protein A2017_18195 [Lentisphaerae bacterium GWF2_44_16]